MTLEDPFTDAAVASLRRRHDWRALLEENARRQAEWFDALRPDVRRLGADLGRSAVAITLLLLRAVFGRVTAQDLMTTLEANGAASRSRTRTLVRSMLDQNLVLLEEGPGRWTERDLAPGEALLDAYRGRFRIDLELVSVLFPEVNAALIVFDEPEFERLMRVHMAALVASRRDIFVEEDTPIGLFFRRDGGSRVLLDFLLAQRPGRARMLETAAFEPSRLARNAHVSRAQIYRLVEDGEAQGLMVRTGGSLDFSNTLSEDYERHAALMFLLLREAALRTAEVL